MGGRLREWLRRLMSWSRRGARDRDFDEELQAHVALAASEEMSRGVPADEARRRALARLGGVDAAREQHRDARGLPWLESLGRDLRDAVRLLRRSPGFAFVAIASLALGIGANTAVFSIFNALLLRPLPVREPERLVQVARDPRQTVFSYPLWEQIRAHGEIFDGTAAWSSIGANLIQDGALVPVAVGWTSGDFASVLDLRAQRGRWLTLDDERRAKDGGDKMAVVSDAFWRTRLGGADDVIGRVLTLDQFPVTIVGIATPDFTGMEVGNAFDLIVPITAQPRRALNARTDWWVSVYARLKAEQTTAQASAALRAVQPEIREATLPLELRPDLRDGYLRQPMSVASATTGGTSGLRFRYRDPLSLTMAGVGLLLLITCANLTNLLLARADARRHEISLRLALGASRTRLVRQLLVESLLLSTIGAAAGLLVAAWSSRLLIQQLSTDVTRVSLALPLDGRVLAFATLAAVVTTLVVGLVPAFRATRVAPRAALAERGRANAAASGRLGHALVAIQIALSFVLLTGAGLLGRSFLTLGRADLGFDPRPVATVTMTLRPGASWGEDASRTSRLQRPRDVARATPGVASAAFAGGTPMSGNQQDWFVENTPGLSLPESQRDIYFQDVGSGWFETLGMRVIAGRDFGDADRAQFDRGAIVNDTLARRFFPGQIAIGRTLREVAFGNDAPHLWTIVGVVNDAVYMNAREGVPPTLYRFVPAHSVLVARAADGDAATMARDVAAAIARADPDVLVSTRRLADQASATLVRERLVATLSLLFGVLALVLASAGVYGVMAYTVGRRRGEIGIRRALGATTPAIAGLVLRQSSMLAAIGLLAGAAASLWAMRFVQPLLYGLEPYDAITLAGTALILALVTLAASWTPIRRATRVDPAAVLREN